MQLKKRTKTSATKKSNIAINWYLTSKSKNVCLIQLHSELGWSATIGMHESLLYARLLKKKNNNLPKRSIVMLMQSDAN